ncbi:MAG: porin, partial [Betaproteobacteria bacterium]|nr:porin [Candidatus Proximibacter danicus]
MQKKVIALAVAGLVSGAAFAQSNVTIYGQMDMAYERSSTNDATAANTGVSRNNINGQTNVIGFK